MSMIRNLLYNGTINNDFVNSTLYNQTLLHKFILQHQPKYILHCGCPFNALALGHFIKENYACEILHIKNWQTTPTHYFDKILESANPHQKFLDKIVANGLQNQIVSFNGDAVAAYETLTARHLRFCMLVSDTINNDTDYIKLLPLVQKKALHIRYVGHKNLCDIKNEGIFNINSEMSVTYAQGYLVTGMDYLSLYDEQAQMPLQAQAFMQPTTLKPLEEAPIIPKKTEDISPQDAQEMIWTENGFVYADVLSNTHNDTISVTNHTATISQETVLSAIEERNLRREERRQAREQRREQRREQQEQLHEEAQETLVNHIVTAHAMAEEINPTHFSLNTNDTISDNHNDDTSISATRRALRAKRLARRMALANKHNQD